MHEWITTYTGKRFSPLHPDPDDVDIEDIAHALSQICRFGGHTKEFYSVAQHCYYVAELVEEWLLSISRYWKKGVVAQALLHDASEAYLGDVVTPVKVTMGDYKRAEALLQAAIFEGLGLYAPVPFGEVCVAIKKADQRMFLTEYIKLFGGTKPYVNVSDGIEPWTDLDIECWSSDVAEENFLGMWEHYKPNGT